jgi:Domain of unknown function (DUF4221)
MKSIAIIVCLFVIMSCEKQASSDSEQQKNNKFRIDFVKNIDFALDRKTTNWSINSHYILNPKTQKESIYILGLKTSVINVFNLDGENIKKIKFERDGPNGIGTFRGFFCKNEDSLYIISDNFKVYTVSSDAKVLHSYFLMESPDSYRSWAWSEDGTDMFYKNNILYIPAIPGIDFDKNRKDFYQKGLLSIAINMNSGNIKRQIPFPNIDVIEAKNVTSTVVGPKCVAKEDTKELIYSFAYDPYVYRYDLNGNLKGKYLLKSRSVPAEVAEVSSKSIIGDPMLEAVYLMNNSFYGNLHYDPFQKLFYRLIKHKLDKEATKKDLMKGRVILEKYSMIVADENLNTLGEIDLANNGEDGFEGNGLFVITKNGILIQNIEKTDEDKIFFKLYKVVKK